MKKQTFLVVLTSLLSTASAMAGDYITCVSEKIAINISLHKSAEQEVTFGYLGGYEEGGAAYKFDSKIHASLTRDVFSSGFGTKFTVVANGFSGVISCKTEQNCSAKIKLRDSRGESWSSSTIECAILNRPWYLYSE